MYTRLNIRRTGYDWWRSLRKRRLLAQIKKLRNRHHDSTEVDSGQQVRNSNIWLIDLTDFLAFIAHESRITGIQRVQCELVREFLNSELEAPCANAQKVTFCVRPDRGLKLFALPNAFLQELMLALASSSPRQDVLQKKVKEILRNKREIVPFRNDLFFILGAFWNGPPYAELLLYLKTQGLRTGVYIYDILPYTHAQFFLPPLTRSFQSALLSVLDQVDFCLTISKHVASEVTMLCKSRHNSHVDIVAVPLAHQFSSSYSPTTDIDSGYMPNTCFVLSVSTIEVRKNHELLVRVWVKLYSKYGDKLPSLVLVGKWGWRVDSLKALLHDTNSVNGKVIILNEANDTQLRDLYKSCLFSAFVSFAEGWGLPVGESLSFGKTCVCSDVTSISEVGGDLCLYVDPSNEPGVLQVIEQLIFEPEFLTRMTKRVALEFRQRTWQHVTSDLKLNLERQQFAEKYFTGSPIT